MLNLTQSSKPYQTCFYPRASRLHPHGLFTHGRLVARRHGRFPRLAEASSDKLEERARREENSSTHSTRNRPAPRIQGKTRNSHGQSPSSTRGREETKASFREETESNGSFQVHQSDFPPECGRETSSEEIPELGCTRFLPPLFGRNQPLVRSDPYGSPSSRSPRIIESLQSQYGTEKGTS